MFRCRWDVRFDLDLQQSLMGVLDRALYRPDACTQDLASKSSPDSSARRMPDVQDLATMVLSADVRLQIQRGKSAALIWILIDCNYGGACDSRPGLLVEDRKSWCFMRWASCDRYVLRLGKTRGRCRGENHGVVEQRKDESTALTAAGRITNDDSSIHCLTA